MTLKHLKLGAAVWNPADMSLTGPEGETVQLSNKAREALACLADAAGDVVARETLESTVWPEVPVEEAAVARVLAEIRQAIGDGDMSVLRPVPETGLRLVGRWIEVPDKPPAAPSSRKGLYLTAAVVLLVAAWILLQHGA